MKLQRVISIIRKDVTLDLRQLYSVSSVFMFALTCAYLIYRTFGADLSKQVWNILLWIIVLFVGINAVIKSFNQESRGTMLYYYTLFGALEVVCAKIIYNTFYLLLSAVLLLLSFIVLFGFPVTDIPLFFVGGLGGILGISVIFTFVSIVASQENGNTVMSILSLPLVLPLVMLLVKVTSVAMNLMGDSTIWQDVGLIYAIDILLIGLVILIFPSMWRA